MKIQDRNIANTVFCERLALLTTRASLIQMQLCDIAKISQGAILDYLKGKSEPKAEALYRLSRAFSVTMEWLWGRDSNEYTAKSTSAPTSSRETLLESKLRMATSALESILKELKKK